MTEHFSRLTKHVCSKLRMLGFLAPTPSVVRALLEIAYIASITTEENRFVRGSLTYSDPKAPELDPPRLRRADYPSFTAFGQRTLLEAGALVKTISSCRQMVWLHCSLRHQTDKPLYLGLGRPTSASQYSAQSGSREGIHCPRHPECKYRWGWGCLDLPRGYFSRPFEAKPTHYTRKRHSSFVHNCLPHSPDDGSTCKKHRPCARKIRRIPCHLIFAL